MTLQYSDHPADPAGYLPIWYAGHTDGSVTIISGMKETPLPHLVKHSPTGFSWGYAGSGPAELARCLLIHALGPRSRCKVCDGTGQVVYNPDGHEIPVAEAEARYDSDEVDFNSVFSCMACEDGCAVMPAIYQTFKFEVVTKMTQGQAWSMPQAEVLSWWESYQRDANYPDQ